MTPMIHKGRQRGSALLIVLWFLILVSAIAVSMSRTTRVESRLAFNLVEEARARHLAQAGINHTILTLLAEQTSRHRIRDGSVGRIVDLFGEAVTIRVRDECGKLDLNTAWGGLVAAMVASRLEDDEERAFAVSQAILDWRDPDKIRRPRGAEDDDYTQDGAAYGARDGLFETIEELQQVRGMTKRLYDRLAPDITVDCLAAGIDPLAASPAALAAIPGFDRAALDGFLNARRNARKGGNEVAMPAALLGSKFIEPSLGDVYTINATVDLPSGTAFTWQAVVWLTGDPNRSYVIRAWRRAYQIREGGIE